MAKKKSRASVMERLCALFNSAGDGSGQVMPYGPVTPDDMPWIWLESSGNGKKVSGSGISGDTYDGEFQLFMRLGALSPEDSLEASRILEELASGAMSRGAVDGVEVREHGTVYERESSAEQATAVYGLRLTVRYSVAVKSTERCFITITSPSVSLRVAHRGTCRIVEGGLEGFDYPSLDVSFSENALHSGSHVKRQRIGTRFLSVRFEVCDAGVFPEVRAKVQRLMDPTSEVEIETVLYGNRRFIKAFPYKAPEFSRKSLSDVPVVKLSFASEEPFFTEGEEREVPLPVEEGLLSFPLNIMKGAGTVLSFKEASDWHNVVNVGDVPVGFEATIKVTGRLLSSPSISIGSSRVTYSGTLKKGDVLVIDTRYGQKSVRVNGYYTYDVERNAHFFELQPGDNRFSIGVGSGSGEYEASLRYTPLYLGA